MADWDYPGKLHEGPFKSSFISDQDASLKVKCFGDSHAEQYGPLVSNLNRQQLSSPTLFLTGGACLPIPNVYSDIHSHCQDFMDRFQQVLSTIQLLTQ